MTEVIVVCAAIIEDGARFLISRRQAGVHLEGYWEFPGGKCEKGETLHACLARELREELGVGAEVGEELLSTTHVYSERTVELHFLRSRVIGKPVPQVGQELRWASLQELRHLEFPPADLRLIQMLTRK